MDAVSQAAAATGFLRPIPNTEPGAPMIASLPRRSHHRVVLLYKSRAVTIPSSDPHSCCSSPLSTSGVPPTIVPASALSRGGRLRLATPRRRRASTARPRRSKLLLRATPCATVSPAAASLSLHLTLFLLSSPLHRSCLSVRAGPPPWMAVSRARAPSAVAVARNRRRMTRSACSHQFRPSLSPGPPCRRHLHLHGRVGVSVI